MMDQKKRYQNGFVLIVSLIVIIVFMLLTSILLTLNDMQTRFYRNQWSRLKIDWVSSIAFKKIYQQLLKHSVTCLSSPQSNDFWIHQDSSFWSSNQVCHFQYEGYSFSYVIEPIQLLPCFTLDHQMPSEYERIILWIQNPNKKDVELLLEQVVALPDPHASAICYEKKITLPSSMQSWRILYC